jgi:uncharacterized membrane protein
MTEQQHTHAAQAVALTFKEALDVALNVSSRIHATWSLFIASAIAVVGWLIEKDIKPSTKVIVTVAALLACYASTTTIVLLNAYLGALAAEAREAATEYRFRTKSFTRVMKSFGAVPSVVVATVNVGITLMVIVVAWRAELGAWWCPRS